MYKKLHKKFVSASFKTRCNVTIEIQRLEGLPEVVKQLKVVWEKDGKMKASTDLCTVHKGQILNFHAFERGHWFAGSPVGL